VAMASTINIAGIISLPARRKGKSRINQGFVHAISGNDAIKRVPLGIIKDQSIKMFGNDNLFFHQPLQDMPAIFPMFFRLPFIFLVGNLFPNQSRSGADFQNQGFVFVTANFLHADNTGAFPVVVRFASRFPKTFLQSRGNC
jgi:hypothetical protein